MWIASAVSVLALSLSNPTTGTLQVNQQAVEIQSPTVKEAGTTFEGATVIDGVVVPLRGAATLKYLTFRVYSAALYIPENSTPDELDAPIRLTLHYHRTIEGKDIVEASRLSLQKNPSLELAPIQERLDRFLSWIVTVREGDRYDLVHLPGKGLGLLLNGRPLGFIPGDDFARAYLGIWLSDYPLNDGFRDRLLEIED